MKFIKQIPPINMRNCCQINFTQQFSQLFNFTHHFAFTNSDKRYVSASFSFEYVLMRTHPPSGPKSLW